MFRRFSGVAASALLLGFVACSDDNPSGGFDVPVYGDSSSSVEPAPKSSGDVGGSAANVASSSSQNVAESSSSVIANSSSSVKVPKNTAACMWKGTEEYVPVKTGLDPDDKYSAGYWYNFGDYAEGGKSFVRSSRFCDDQLNEWECEVRIVEECGGFCGALDLDRGTASEAYVGFAFNVAGFEDPYSTNSKVKVGDISDWGGVCVTYAADQDVYLELEADSAHLYEAKLDKSIDFVEKCVTWKELNAVESSKQARSIRLKMKSIEKITGHLTVAAIGKYDSNGACEVDGYAYALPKGNGLDEEGLIVLRSSSSEQNVSSSSAGRDCNDPELVSGLWDWLSNPGSGIRLTTGNRVITGLDNDTETSGYWFSFGDDMSGVGSVKWPQPLGREYTTDDEMFDYCMGVCGELEFAKEGYLGVGFHVAGVVDPMDDNSLVAKANISSWGGLCVTYASESDLEVVLTYAQTSGFGDFSRMPRTTLPKSVKLNTVCTDWDDYMSMYSEVSTTFMTSILFAVQGNANTKSRINIRGLGWYSDKTNFCSTGEDPFVSGKKSLVIP